MQTESFFQKMSDGFEISVNRWLPDQEKEIKGVVHLCHGMQEYVLRYDRLGKFLSERGYVFSAHDQRGHGKTAEQAEIKGCGMFGKLADKDGFNRVTMDLNEVIEEDKKTFPGKKIILLGHSFGSFVSQNYIETYGNKDIEKCILCGTSGPNSAAGFGRFLNRIFRFFRGEDFKSELFSFLVFGSYNKKVPRSMRKTGFEWLSKNPENVTAYVEDPLCGRVPALSFFKDLLNGLGQIHKSENMKKIPQSLPVFFIYGTDDPVGNYGKSIQKLISIYKGNGMTQIDFRAYESLRHELFNENEWEKIAEDCFSFIEASV